MIARILVFLMLVLLPVLADAQCVGVGGINTLNNCADAVDLQPTDYLAAWQNAPGSSRRASVQQVLNNLTAGQVSTALGYTPLSSGADFATAFSTALPAALAAPPPIGGTTPGAISTRWGIDATDPQYAGGMKCNGATDPTSVAAETAAFQAGLIAADANHSARPLMLPSGTCVHSGVIAHAPVWIQCAGRNNTILNTALGVTVPNISVSMTAADWPNADPSARPYVTIADCQIGAIDKTDAPGQGLAHGVASTGLVSASPAAVQLILFRDLITHNPGDCVHLDNAGGNHETVMRAIETECSWPSGNGLSENSQFDAQWSFGPIHGAGINNIQLSGSTNIRVSHTNLFDAVQNDVSVFESSINIDNSILDETGQNNLFMNNPSGRKVQISLSQFNGASSTANATYSSIRMAATNTGNVYLSNDNFETPASSPKPNKPLNNINFMAGNTGHVFVDPTTNFDLGPVSAAGVTNNVDGIVQVGAGTMTLLSVEQFDGYRIINGQGNLVAKMFSQNPGSDSTGDGGALQLLNAGATTIGLNGGATFSYFNQDLYLGNTGSSATPVARNMRGTDGNGTDIAGAALNLVGGRGTGAGNGGDVVLSAASATTTGAGTNTATERLRAMAAGGVKIAPVTFNVASSGNGADLTEDTLTNCSGYSLPGNSFVNVGDTLHIVASGAMGATTDNKVARVKAGGTVIGTITGAAAGQIRWTIDARLSRTALNTQRYQFIGTVNNVMSNGSVSLNLTEATPIAITVTGQNTTNSVAGSVTCDYLNISFGN
jgi:hypothetical protein